MKNDPPCTKSPSRAFNVRLGLNTEEALSNASEILASIIAIGYEDTFTLTEPQRSKNLGVLQLVELAQMLVDQALEREFPTTPA